MKWLGKRDFPESAVVKNLPANAENTRDTGLVPALRRSSGVGNDNSIQYYCLENSMHRGAWQATVQGVAKCHIQLNKHTHTHTHTHTHRLAQGKERTRMIWFILGKWIVWTLLSERVKK